MDIIRTMENGTITDLKYHLIKIKFDIVNWKIFLKWWSERLTKIFNFRVKFTTGILLPRAGVPNLFSAAYHQMIQKKFAYHQQVKSNSAYHLVVLSCCFRRNMCLDTVIFSLLVSITSSNIPACLFFLFFSFQLMSTFDFWWNRNFLRTTWSLSAYHQWYAYHRLGTPDLECIF